MQPLVVTFLLAAPIGLIQFVLHHIQSSCGRSVAAWHRYTFVSIALKVDKTIEKGITAELLWSSMDVSHRWASSLSAFHQRSSSPLAFQSSAPFTPSFIRLRA